MKKVFLGIAVILLTVSVFAFKKPVEKDKIKKDLTTYVYTGDNSLSQQRNAEFYMKDNDADPCSGQQQRICLIVTSTDEGDHPDFSSGNPVDNPELFEDVSYKPFQ